MRFRSLLAALALACVLASGAAAKKKTPHSTPPTAKKTKIKKFKPLVKGRKANSHVVAKHKVVKQKVNR